VEKLWNIEHFFSLVKNSFESNLNNIREFEQTIDIVGKPFMSKI
jgi:hypothetical protein